MRNKLEMNVYYFKNEKGRETRQQTTEALKIPSPFFLKLLQTINWKCLPRKLPDGHLVSHSPGVTYSSQPFHLGEPGAGPEASSIYGKSPSDFFQDLCLL